MKVGAAAPFGGDRRHRIASEWPIWTKGDDHMRGRAFCGDIDRAALAGTPSPLARFCILPNEAAFRVIFALAHFSLRRGSAQGCQVLSSKAVSRSETWGNSWSFGREHESNSCAYNNRNSRGNRRLAIWSVEHAVAGASDDCDIHSHGCCLCRLETRVPDTRLSGWPFHRI